MLDVIYEDKSILVVYKPAGIATETKRLGQQDMVSLIRNYRAAKGEEPYVGLVHRLDQPVEGIMLFAKTNQAAGILSKQVRERQIGKFYYALLQGIPETKEGQLEHLMVSDKRANCSYVIKEKKASLGGNAEFAYTMTDAQAKAKNLKIQKALLSYKVVKENDNLSPQALVNIELGTGRHHQIRLQFSAMGYPLVGDRKYGDCKEGREGGNIALCSYRLDFLHPDSGKQMSFTIEPKGKFFLGFF